MSLAPPAPKILGPKDPGLAIGAIGDRQARLRGPAGLVGVVPVISFAGGEALAQISEIGRAARDRGIGMTAGIAPVRERRIEIDADRADGGRSPERIERKIDTVAIAADIRAILCPVGGIGQRGARQHGLDVLRDGNELVDHRIAGCATQMRQPDHLGTDHEAVDAAGCLRQHRAMHDEPAIGPLVRLGAGDAGAR